MGEHADNPDRTEQSRQDEDATRAISPVRTSEDSESAGSATQRRRRSSPSVDWNKAKDQIVALLAAVARWLGVIFAVILVLQVIFVIGEANQDNGIATFVRNFSDSVAIGFGDLFTPDDMKLRILVNYGIAALFWLVVSAIVAKIIRRIGDSIDV